MVGINLFGFHKFELFRGEGEGGGGGGGGGPGGDDGTGATDVDNQGGLSAQASTDANSVSVGDFSNEEVGAGAVSANTQNFGVSPAQANAQFGTTSGSTGFDFGGTPQADIDAEMGGGLNANAAGFNAAQAQAEADASANAEAAAQAEVESLGFGIEDFGSVTPDVQDDGFNQTSFDAMMGVEDDNSVTPGFDSLSVAQDPSEVADISFNPAAFEAMTGLDITGVNPSDLTAQSVTDDNAAAITDNLSFFEDDTQEVTNAINALAATDGVTTAADVTTPSGIMGLSDEDVDVQAMGIAKNKDPNTSGVTADTLYGTSLVTGKPTTAMSPIQAQAMTGGSTSVTNNTGMNLAQQTDNVEATNQAQAMDVLGAQIGAGNLTGNEDIDQVNIELAKQGVQIDSGIPGILGTGVNALNKNYQLSQNQDILSQLAQGSNVPNTGVLGTGIGAIKGINTYTPAYNKQGQIVGSVATDAAGNAVGGGAGITTNVVGGLNAMPDLYSDAAGTELYTGANEAVGDFQDMTAASQSSEEGPPEDVTSVDANGCVIGSEFFDGQKCSPIGSTVTGDATGGGTGGGFTPYNYQPGQGTMLKPDFSDVFTSNVNFGGINPNASNMNFLKPAVNPYGNFAGGGIVDMMRNNRYR